VPKSRTRSKKQGHQERRRPSGRWRPGAAISSHDPSGLPDILFPADFTGFARPDFTGEELDFVVASPDATELARVTLRFERRWATSAAVDAWGFDTSKALTAHIRVQRSGRWSLDMQTAADPLSASQALLVLTLVNVLVPPNAVALTVCGSVPDGYSALETPSGPRVPEGMEYAVTLLARLEEHIGEPIAVPEAFTGESLEQLRVAAELLGGATVQGMWSEIEMEWAMTAAQARDLATGPLGEGAADIDLTRSWPVDLGDGRQYTLSPVLAHLHSVRVKKWPETDGLRDDALVAVVLEPADAERGMDLRLSRRATGQRERSTEVMMEDDPLTLVPADVFDELLASLDEASEPPTALVRATARLRAIRA
jgi:hypothetical protein